MSQFVNWIHHLDWTIVVLFCLTLGLAPFAPPHIVEKLGMLFNGTLKRPLDWFDLFFHGVPWILLIVKIIIAIRFGIQGP